MPAAPDPEKNDSVLAAMQLGWLAVEAFGLLRRYSLHGKPPAPGKDGATQRFNFTERKPNLTEQLLISARMLKDIAARLAPDSPPPVPDDLSKLLDVSEEDINTYWSRKLWNHLQVTDPLAGQAFTCGGDLADTYWYAQRAGAEKLAEMLRSYRLAYISERLNDFTGFLPKHAVGSIQHSLKRWIIGERVKDLDKDGQARLLERLESQVKVWRDLLFGLRLSSSYLTRRDQRQVTWGLWLPQPDW
jgi:hypothetical protein